MSASTEITRLQDARNTIRDKLIELGLANSTAKMDALATAVDGIENKGAVSASVKEGETYTIPKGYHNGSGTVSGVAGGGDYGLQSKVVTPTKNQQSVTADQGFYGLSDVTVKPIPDAYQNVSGVTAAAGDVLANKIIVDAAGNSVAGTMKNNGAVTKTLDATKDNQSYAIPKGYHNGSGSVGISLESRAVTPSEQPQTVTPSSGKVIGSVAVEPIPDEYIEAKETVQDITDNGAAGGDQATADQLLAGKTLWGYSNDSTNPGVVKLTGTMPNNGAVSKTLDATTGNQEYAVPKGYHNGSGSVKIVLEEKTVAVSETDFYVRPTAGKVLSSVHVGAIPSSYADATDATLRADDLLEGKTAWGDNPGGSGAAYKYTGSMKNNGAVSGSIDGLVTTSYTVPKGYHDGTGKVSLTDDIEKALAAI